MKKSTSISKLAALALFVFLNGALEAQIPVKLNFQGVLTDNTSTPIDGSRDFIFSIYDGLTGGSLLWTETQISISVTKGLYSVQLGVNTALTIPFDKAYFLQVQVGAEVLTPRIPLTSSPYSLAMDAGGLISGILPVARIGASSIDNTKLASGSVASSTILDNTIADADISGTAAIAGTKVSPAFGSQGISTTGAISGGSLTTTGAVIAASLTGTIAVSNLSGSVLVANGGTGGTTQATARAGIGLGSLSTLNTITSSEITDLSIATADLNDGSVTAAKLAATTVTPASYGNSTQVGTFTVDAQGRLTAASNVTITGAAPTGAAGGDLTGNFPNPTIASAAITSTKMAASSVSGGLAGTISDNSITNDDVSGSAAIAGTKINPAFGTQNISTTGTATATSFTGNGAGLTSLAAANITGSNTLPPSVLPTTVPQGNGTNGNVTYWTGIGSVGSSANFAWNNGTSTLAATNISGSGAGLTALNGSNVTSGSVGVANGGTGGTNQATARAGLGLGSLATLNTITSSEITDLSIATSDLNDGSVTASKLATTSVTPASYGNSTQVATFTVDGQGRLTAASSVTITGAAPTGAAGGDLSGNYPNPSIATGAVTSGKMAASSVSGGLAGTISDNSITNDDIAAAAAIEGTKVNPAFGTQNISTTGTATATSFTGSVSDANLEATIDRTAFNASGNISAVGSVTAASFSGSGASLTTLSASNISSGTIADARLETNVDLAGHLSTIGGVHVGGVSDPGTDNLVVDGTVTAVGSVTAASFSGSGAAVTSLNASNISSGTIADARLETNVDLGGYLSTVGGVHVGGTSDPGTDNLVVDGTVTAVGSVTAASFSGAGSSITSLSGSNISSGTVAVANGGTGSTSLTGALIGNGTGAVTGLASSGASQYLRRNTGNTAYEFGTLAVSSSEITDGAIANSDVSGTAAIVGTKISPDFGAQNVVTTGSLAAGSGHVSVTSTGYTRLGSSGVMVTISSPLGAAVTWPVIRILKIAGTCAAADGTATVTLSGLTESKIISIEVIVEFTTGDYVHAGYTNTTGLQFNYYYQNNILNIKNITGNSAGLAGRPFKAIIAYEE